MSGERSVADEGWAEFCDEYGNREPREMPIRIPNAFGSGEHGRSISRCGPGIDTLAMLRAGWRVFATAPNPEGIRHPRARVPGDPSPGLRAELACMEDVELPPADLV